MYNHVRIGLLIGIFAMSTLWTAPLLAAVKWGDFTLEVTSEQEVRSMLLAKNSTILEDGQFAPTRGRYILAMNLPYDTHALSCMFIFDNDHKLQGIFSKYPPEMFEFARDSFGKLYRVAWVEYSAESYPQSAQELAKKGGYELVVTEKGEHAIVYDIGEYILRLVSKTEGLTQVEIMTKHSLGL